MKKLTKTSYWLLVATIAGIILHNVIFAIFHWEEPFFFVLGILLALSFFVSILYNLYSYLRYKKPKDVWKLGFIGLLGLIALLPGFGYGFYGFLSYNSLTLFC